MKHPSHIFNIIGKVSMDHAQAFANAVDYPGAVRCAYDCYPCIKYSHVCVCTRVYSWFVHRYTYATTCPYEVF